MRTATWTTVRRRASAPLHLLRPLMQRSCWTASSYPTTARQAGKKLVSNLDNPNTEHCRRLALHRKERHPVGDAADAGCAPDDWRRVAGSAMSAERLLPPRR